MSSPSPPPPVWNVPSPLHNTCTAGPGNLHLESYGKGNLYMQFPRVLRALNSWLRQWNVTVFVFCCKTSPALKQGLLIPSPSPSTGYGPVYKLIGSGKFVWMKCDRVAKCVSVYVWGKIHILPSRSREVLWRRCPNEASPSIECFFFFSEITSFNTIVLNHS